MEWQPVKEFEGFYEISNGGDVRSLERVVPHKICRNITIKQKLLDTRINNSGYLEVRLSKHGKTYTKFIHILKAQVFVPNPGNKTYVNHIDGNKLNNDNDNLQWCTHSENIKHAYANGLIKPICKPVIDICTGDTFESAKIAARVYQISYHTLRNYLNGGISENPTCLQYKVAA